MTRIIIKKLIMQGTSFRRTIEFNEGLTIISGEKTSGKSLILSLIDYCFGKGEKIDLSVQKELSNFCDQIYLEILINEDVITLNRDLKKNFDKIKIYFCPFIKVDEFTPKIVNLKEVMSMLMQKMGINEYKLIRHKQHSTEKEIELISFRDVFRYVYIHQHELGTDNFLGNKSTFKANKNPHTFKMIFNLIEVDKDTLNEKIVEIENAISSARKEIIGLQSYLKDRDAEDPIKLQLKVDKVAQEIEDRKREKAEIVQNSNVNENKENQLYIKLKRDLKSIADEVFNLRSEEKLLNLSISSKSLLLEEYEAELIEVKETLELNYKLVIANQTLECPLCNSQINHHHTDIFSDNNETEVILQKIKKEIESKRSLVSGLIETDIKKIKRINQEIINFNQKREIFDEAIKVFSKKTEVPFLSQLETLNSIINQLTKKQEILRESLRIYRKIEEKENFIIEQGVEVERLKAKLSALQIKGEEKENTFNFLNQEYKAFMKRLKYELFEDSYIHKEKFIPYYNGASVYSHESGGLLESMQLSYLGAILKSKEVGYAKGHPGLLMVDSISKYVGTLKNQDPEVSSSEEISKAQVRDPEVYEEFYKILVELGEYHQIILVENTPPPQFDKIYTKYTFYNGKDGLINEEMNELKEVD
ncbi:hypothetical protein [Paenibacillus dauci]|uniref:hypothetical protein n=1 Tax=Paenibacillus dauci TaxID=1567106 RepID=UPI000619EF5E|nr:hypothetical protein [Paenibacillus dauci]